MRYNLCVKTQIFAFNENKIYSGCMETKAKRQTARGRPLCKWKVAGANPAESNNIFLVVGCDGLLLQFNETLFLPQAF